MVGGSSVRENIWVIVRLWWLKGVCGWLGEVGKVLSVGGLVGCWQGMRLKIINIL